MKVAVLGATGATGSLVVRLLLEGQHDVVAISRSPLTDTAEASQLSCRVGDLTEAAFMRSAITGCDAVISCLGQNRASNSLFARRTSPPDILRRVAAATVEAIGSGCQHFIYMSAGWARIVVVTPSCSGWSCAFSSIHAAYVDHAAAEAIIRDSLTRWTIVRPPGLSDADEEVLLVDKGDEWSSFDTVSRRSVAAFLAHCAEQGGALHRTITIGKPDQ